MDLEDRAAELRRSLAAVEQEIVSNRKAQEARARDERRTLQMRLERQIDDLIRQIPDRDLLDYRKETASEIRERRQAELSAWAGTKDDDYF